MAGGGERAGANGPEVVGAREPTGRTRAGRTRGPIGGVPGGDPRAGNFGISLKALRFSLMCEKMGHRNFRLRGARGGGGGKIEFSLKVFVFFGPKIFLIKIKKKRALRARVSAREIFFSKIFEKLKIFFKKII